MVAVGAIDQRLCSMPYLPRPDRGFFDGLLFIGDGVNAVANGSALFGVVTPSTQEGGVVTLVEEGSL